jgi:hypothetical protein
MASTVCYGDIFTFLYVDDVRTSQETHLCSSTVCYKYVFTSFYVDYVRRSQETHLWASTVCYRDSFTEYTCALAGVITLFQRKRDRLAD